MTNHKCVSSDASSVPSGGGAGGVAPGGGLPRVPSAGRPGSLGGVGSRSDGSTSSGAFRRPRSNDMLGSSPPNIGAGGTGGASVGGVLAHHHNSVSSGELSSPDFVKRLSSNSPLSLTGLLRRGSTAVGGGRSLGPGTLLLPPSFTRHPSGLAGGSSLGLNGVGAGAAGAGAGAGHTGGNSLSGGGGGGSGVSGSVPRGLSSMFGSPAHGAMEQPPATSGPGGVSMSDYLLRASSIPPAEAASLLLHGQSGDHSHLLGSGQHGHHLASSSASPPPGMPRRPSATRDLSALRLRSRDDRDLFGQIFRGSEQHHHHHHHQDAAAAAAATAAANNANSNGINSQQQRNSGGGEIAATAAVVATSPDANNGKRKETSPQPDPTSSAAAKRAKLQQEQQQHQLLKQQLPPPVTKFEVVPNPRKSPMAASKQRLAAAAAAAAASAASPPSAFASPFSYSTSAANAGSFASGYPCSSSSSVALHIPLDPSRSGSGSGSGVSLALAYDVEFQRMDKVLHLLAAWTPSASAASADLLADQHNQPMMMMMMHPAAAASTADDMVRQFQAATNAFRREVADSYSASAAAASVASSSAAAVSAASKFPARRLRICEALVTLSLTHGERASSSSSSSSSMDAAASSAASGGGGGGGGALSMAGAGTMASAAAAAASSSSSFGASLRLPVINHPMLGPLSRCLCLLSSALMLSELEMAVFSLYLDRLSLSDWATRLDRSALQHQEQHNMRALHYAAYMVKLSFTEQAGAADDPLLAYLAALYPDFSLAFCTWLHEKGAIQMHTPPIALNHRFKTITAFAGVDRSRSS